MLPTQIHKGPLVGPPGSIGIGVMVESQAPTAPRPTESSRPLDLRKI